MILIYFHVTGFSQSNDTAGKLTVDDIYKAKQNPVSGPKSVFLQEVIHHYSRTICSILGFDNNLGIRIGKYIIQWFF